PEAALQRTVLAHLAWRGAPNVFAFHCPNGGYRSRTEAAILWSLGVGPGIPDGIILQPRPIFSLQLKAESGRLPEIKRAWPSNLRVAVAQVAVARGVDQATHSSRPGNCFAAEAARRPAALPPI